jgi:hypothetical protein
MACIKCENCLVVTNVAGMDCYCKSKSEYDASGGITLQFEVSPDDDISFYSEDGHKPCENFVPQAM